MMAGLVNRFERLVEEGLIAGSRSESGGADPAEPGRDHLDFAELNGCDEHRVVAELNEIGTQTPLDPTPRVILERLEGRPDSGGAQGIGEVHAFLG
jgi:hypothetical protein